jgi:hypothetical protein
VQEPSAPELLSQASAEQARYDNNAYSWQLTHLRARLGVLVLGVLTALVGVARSYGTLRPENLGGLFGGGGNEALSTATLIVLGTLPVLAAVISLLNFAFNPGQRWVAYRTGSESLKTEAFLFATSAEPYSQCPTPKDRRQLFEANLGRIARLVEGLQPPDLWTRLAGLFPMWERQLDEKRHVVGAPQTPANDLDATAYLEQRLRPQRDWYDRRSKDHRQTQMVMAALVFLTNTAAGAMAFMGEYHWVPLLMTVVGALTAYSGMTNAEFLANSYRQTVQQLNDLEAAWLAGAYPADRFSDFVQRVEQVIAREYTGWVHAQPAAA